MCSYTMQNHSLQVRGGDMPLLSFQSGCKRWIQTVVTHTVYLLCPSVAIQTHSCHIHVLYCHQLFVLQAILGFPTSPRAHDTALLNEQDRAACRCNDFRDSVIYSHATWTSITVVSKFPGKRGEPACMNSRYQALLSDFFERLRARLVSSDFETMFNLTAKILILTRGIPGDWKSCPWEHSPWRDGCSLPTLHRSDCPWLILCTT